MKMALDKITRFEAAKRIAAYDLAQIYSQRETPDGKVAQIKAKMIEILSNSLIADYCSRFGPLELSPVALHEEGGAIYLNLGYVSSNSGKKVHREDIEGRFSFFTRLHVGPLDLDSPYRLDGKLIRISPERKITRDEGIGCYITLEDVQGCGYDNYIAGLAKPNALPDPIEAQTLDQGYWLRGKISLTPEYLEKSLHDALNRSFKRVTLEELAALRGGPYAA